MKQQSERLASGLNLKLVNDLNSPLDKKRQVKEQLQDADLREDTYWKNGYS